MTIETIKAALVAKCESLELIYGDGDLNPANNTSVTDELATVLETVNPNHDYPPVVKS